MSTDEIDSADGFILIGPWCAGKTTLGRLLAGDLLVDLDDVALDYWAELGWSVERLLERNRAAGLAASEQEWEHVRAHCVLRLLEDRPTGPLSLGAAYTDFVDQEHSLAVEQALRADSRPVVLVTPSLGLDEDALSRERAIASRGREWATERSAMASWRSGAMFRRVADIILETRRQTPNDTARRLRLALAEWAGRPVHTGTRTRERDQ